MPETRVHPETGKLLRRDVRQETVRFGSMARIVDVPGWYPDDGSDAIHTGVDLKASNEAYKSLRDAYAARVKTVRKKLGLTQEEAGVIIGGGKRAFQKYESGTNPPSDAAIGLIELLARHPEEVETLRTFRPALIKGEMRAPKRAGATRAVAARRGARGARKLRA